MHESGIAAEILEVAARISRENRNWLVTGVRIKVGDFSNVVPEALEFAFDALKPGTSSQSAILKLERVPVVTRCGNCGKEGPPLETPIFLCPVCSGPLQVIQGGDIEVVSVDLQEENA